jgi:uncharacterized protein (DUF2267 family)
MDEIVKVVAKKTGLSEEMARIAVETVLSHLKEKLPGPIAGQLNAFLGEGEAGSNLGDLAGSLGGLLGKQ